MPAAKNCRITVARSGAHRADGLFCSRGLASARQDGRRGLNSKPLTLGAAAREGRQATCYSAPPHLEEYLTAYLIAPGRAMIPRGRCSVRGRGTGSPTRTDAAVGERRCPFEGAAAAGIAPNSALAAFGDRDRRLFENGVTLEKAAAMANHASKRTARPLRSPARRTEP
jgi:hypothetical protein